MGSKLTDTQLHNLHVTDLICHCLWFNFTLIDVKNTIFQPPVSEWTHLVTENTNSHGKVTFCLPEDKSLGLGIYQIKMVVR